MKLVPLGKTGLLVSRLCFGALTVGPLQAKLDVEDAARVMAYAIALGVNFFDTAQLYGTYPHIRRAIALSGKHDLIITSKTYAYTRELAQAAVEEALRELGRETIDIFMLHEQESIHTLNGHAEALEYLFECKSRGIIKAVGLSTHHVAGVYGAIEKKLDVIHPLLNIAGLGIVDGTRQDMELAVKKAHDAGIGIYGMKALGGGNLFKKASECLDYALGLDDLDSIAIGMQSVEEVSANVRYFETGRFDEATHKLLNQKTRRLHIDDWCAACGECAKVCGQRALSVQNGKAVCAHEKCVLCGYCCKACPMWAIKVV
jgi:aryl-alcohol dehydrogenase-like predicted oxidoreductase